MNSPFLDSAKMVLTLAKAMREMLLESHPDAPELIGAAKEFLASEAIEERYFHAAAAIIDQGPQRLGVVVALYAAAYELTDECAAPR